MLDGVGHRKHQKNEDERAAQAEDAIIGQQAVARNWTQVAKVLGTCVVSQDFRELYLGRRCGGSGRLEVHGTGLCCNMGHGCDGCESGDFGGEVFFLLADALEFTGGGIVGHVEVDQPSADGVQFCLVNEELGTCVSLRLKCGGMTCIRGLEQCLVIGVALFVF